MFTHIWAILKCILCDSDVMLILRLWLWFDIVNVFVGIRETLLTYQTRVGIQMDSKLGNTGSKVVNYSQRPARIYRAIRISIRILMRRIKGMSQTAA